MRGDHLWIRNCVCLGNPVEVLNLQFLELEVYRLYTTEKDTALENFF